MRRCTFSYFVERVLSGLLAVHLPQFENDKIGIQIQVFSNAKDNQFLPFKANEKASKQAVTIST